MKTTTRLTELAALTALSVACSVDKGPVEPVSPSFERAHASAAPLFKDSVLPQATDPAIDQGLSRHYVWLDTTAKSNHKLFVFMAGHGQRPAMFQRVPEEAARLGYHAIGLTYPDLVSVLGVCSGQADPNACYDSLHMELLDGVDRSPFVDVNAANSIVNRLTKLLRFLADSFPDQGWSRFLADGEPKWSRIVVAGHSQGGAQAATIAKVHVVARVVLFSSVVDRVGTGAASWVATHVTPADRYWGIAHDRDGNFPAIRAGWDSIGMAAFGPAVAPETSLPPYGFTHMLITDLVPQGGFVGSNAHGSPSNDVNTPLNADGSCCRLRDAWRYLLTTNSEDGDFAERGEQGDDTPQFGPWSTPVNLGPVINTAANENHPAISKDGLSLYISSDRPGGLGGTDIWVSQRACTDSDDPACAWQAPVDLGANINSAGNDLAPTFTPDGHHMYFHSTGRGGFGLADVFVAERKDKDDDFSWGVAENLGDSVNSQYADAGPTYFADDATGITTLYFTRQNNPPGSDQGFDIYASTRLGDDAGWSRAVLVPELSSPSRDTRTTIRRDGLEMIISSGRPGGAGSEDLWVSTRASTMDPWSTPVNLGAVVNSASFDGAPALSWDGTTLYFFSERPGGFGKRDLYMTTRSRLRDR